MTNTNAITPFIPGTNIQYAWDSTSLGYLKQCPRLYQYNMIDSWTAKEDNVHLRFGIEYHQALHDYENCKLTGISHDEAVHDTLRALTDRLADYPEPSKDTKPSVKVKNKANLIRTIIWYLDQFEDDPAKTVIMEDGSPAVELSFRFELDFGPKATDQGWIGNESERHLIGQPYLLCGYLDRIVDFGDEFYGMDRKTTTTTPSEYYFNQFEPNNQMSLYTIASQVIFQSPIKGIIIDVAQIAVGFSAFARSFTYRTNDQLAEWMVDLRDWLEKAEGYATRGYWPMNDTACDKYGGCKFREICSKSPQVRERYLEANFKRGERWNPLIAR